MTQIKHKPVVLMILDGYGLSDRQEGNATALAKRPVMERLMREYPFVKGYASGLSVGLPDGQMGNSEVGHMNMGAGRIVYQELTRITKEIDDGTFFENEALLSAMQNCREKGSDLHLFGLLSDGGVHSHITHLYALLEMAKREGVKNVYVDCFLDGRDTPPQSGAEYIRRLEEEMQRLGIGRIAMITGRYYVMDRDNNYDRVEQAYRALTEGRGLFAESAQEAISAAYARGETDEFVKPTVITENGVPLCTVKDDDSVIFYNFRPDRAREISHCFCDDDFDRFERGGRRRVTYVCFRDYDPRIPNKQVAFPDVEITNTFGQYLSALGLKQARIAETEKYAHVTFFFNGGVETPNTGEDRFLIDSPKDVPTYDLKPEMSAYKVCDTLVDKIGSGAYDVIIINFANPDMVGHTGVLPAAVRAVEVVDECVGRAVDALVKAGGAMFLCADHGNCEQMIDPETGAPHTAHTTNPVPFILINYEEGVTLREGGVLADIVPTLIDMMGLKQPAEMTGKSLLVRRK